MTTDQQRAGSSVSRAKTFWEGLSDFYVDHTQLDDLRTRASVEALRREADIRPGTRVLDCGCGHLRMTLGLIRVEPTLEMTGVDLTQELLDTGRDLCEQMGIEPPELHCADLAEMPLPDDSFDAAICARVFQYIPDPVATLRSIYRVLKPGARFALLVPNRLNVLKQLEYKGRLYPPAALGRWLRDAGFEDVHVGSACFVPGFSRRLRPGWDSPLIHAELARKIPGIGLLGGNALGSGRKPGAVPGP